MPDAASEVRTRRRFARRQWARRWGAWRLVLLIVLVVGLVGFGVYGIYFSPWLRVEGAEVSGTSQLTEAEVLAAADVPTGDALARADLDAIEVRVEGRLTAVRSVDAVRQWPHEVRIEIEEWQPLAVVTEETTYSFLAESGDTFTFAGMPKNAPADLPRVVVGAEADRLALEEAAAVVTALDPAVTRLVDHLRVETADRIMLELEGGKSVTWGSADESEAKARVLLNLLDQRPEATSYDVSVPGLPATK